MTDRIPTATKTTERAAEAPDDAELGRIDEAMARLIPALERYLRDHASPSFPAYPPGTVPSESGPLPDEGAGLDVVIDELATAVEWGCRVSAPGFLAFITTGATTAGVLASTATAVAGGQRYLLHAFNALERTGLRWLAELCGLPDGVHGVFSSGGSTANLLALGAARQAAFERVGVDVANDGLPNGVRGRIYASAHAHRTIHRSAAVLGLGRNAVCEIPVDAAGRIDVHALADALRDDGARGIVPIATVAIAGTTDTGAVDRIDEVIEVARRFGSWVHVDGAYGLVADASPALAPLFAGVGDADSWIVDPHKWLATGLGVGATFVRDEGVLTRAFAEGDAAYLEGSFVPDADAGQSQFDLIAGRWSDQGVELSAPPRGVLVWAILREIGREGVVRRVERDVAFARDVSERVRSNERLELLTEPQLSITCFRYVPRDDRDPDELNQRILARVRRETPYIPSSTVIDGVFALRACFINPRTTRQEVVGLVDAVVRIGDELTAG